MIHQQIARHARQPRWETSKCRLVARQRPVNPQKNFLAQILGFRRIARKAVAQVVNAPRVPLYKFLPGRPIAPEAVLHQLGIGLQSCFASLLSSLLGLI
jgi:hypothetical protein